MIAKFNAPPKTPLNDPPAEFGPPAEQSPQVADQPLQVINEDTPAVDVGGVAGADEDDELVQIDNLAGVLSSEDHPPGRLTDFFPFCNCNFNL